MPRLMSDTQGGKDTASLPIPYDGIVRIRFKGSTLCPLRPFSLPQGYLNKYRLDIKECQRDRVLILCARQPAPKPLSIFITPIPGTQELSMAKSAVKPPKFAP
jgi:hypothetical protein